MIPTERRVEQCRTCMADPSSLLKTGVVGAALKLMLNSLVLLMLLLLLLLRVCVFDRYINLSVLLLLFFLFFFEVFDFECFVSWKKQINIYLPCCCCCWTPWSWTPSLRCSLLFSFRCPAALSCSRIRLVVDGMVEAVISENAMHVCYKFHLSR